jgi:hypothetical protein
MRRTGAFVIGLIVAVAGVLFGAWWAPFAVGIAIGVVQGKGRVAIPLGALTGLVAWVLPLARLDLLYGIGPAASSIAAIMGFGHQGLIPIILTLAVGALLGLTGAWLATAIRQIAPLGANTSSNQSRARGVRQNARR